MSGRQHRHAQRVVLAQLLEHLEDLVTDPAGLDVPSSRIGEVEPVVREHRLGERRDLWAPRGLSTQRLDARDPPRPGLSSETHVGGAHHGRLEVVLEEPRSEEHTSELQSLMRIPYAVYCLKKQNRTQTTT